MLNNSEKEYSILDESLQMLSRVISSSAARSAFRYFNTLAVFIIIGLIFSKEAPLESLSQSTIVTKTKTESAYFLDEKTFYQFPLVQSSFGVIPLDQMEHYSKKEARSLILSAVKSGRLKKRLARYITKTMELCEQYQIDPFWALSVMWTESHFNLKATSSVSATGLMQIMPATGVYLSKLLKMPVSETIVYKNIKDPNVNIEMGVFYLKRLLKMFKGSYRLATVAYNMGPGGVYRRLRRKQEVGVNNQYLDKVRRHYKLISKNFSKKSSRKYLSLRSTLVVDNPRSNYLYTRLNDFDEVFHFIEFPSFDYRLALNSIGHSQKSL